jgi:type II restriction/modification system DNA methylase subunit YeeA
MDWSQIEPAIFGTLFERGLDPDKRSQLGAHYTDPDSIMRLVNPTIVEPLLEEWRTVRAEIAGQMERMEKVRTKAATEKRRQAANNALQGFLERLRNFRVLDPACGSGNFLYLALQAIKNIEHRANIEAEALGLERQAPLVGPEVVLGIELNAYAAELARVTVWIGEIQWMLDRGYSLHRKPILKPLDTIEQRDAILNEDGSEPEWPPADVIVGNPPFLGSQKFLRELGEEYVTSIRKLYKGRVTGNADLVTYWYEKARQQVEDGNAKRVGLVATNSIRGGGNRKVLENIIEIAEIYNAWADEPWINEGAAVRVSLVCFALTEYVGRLHLNGESVTKIYPDLTGPTLLEPGAVDLTKVKKLKPNLGVSFQGPVKVGPFDIRGELGRQWIDIPNPHGRSNNEVLRPWANGYDISRRPQDKWIIDFGVDMSTEGAALFEKPFEHVYAKVKPMRDRGRRKGRKKYWWLHGETVPALRRSIARLDRYIATPRVAKHRLFVWFPPKVLPDSALVAIARDDDVSFGILHSKIHELWALALCTWLGVGNDPRYTPSTTFETFPFPDGLTPDLHPDDYESQHKGAIAVAARELVELRDSWVNPRDWVTIEPEVVGGFPDRIIPKSGHEENLKKRTLTNLYNKKPTWLQNAHRKLDEAVAAAYGWSADLSDDEILANLLVLNLRREPA